MSAVDRRSTCPEILAMPSLTCTWNRGRVEPHRAQDDVLADRVLELLVRRTYAATRSARVTMPTSRSPSTTGNRFTFFRVISRAASAIGRFASIVIAGAVIASAARRMDLVELTSCLARLAQEPGEGPMVDDAVAALLDQEIRLRDDAEHGPVDVEHRQAADPVIDQESGDILQWGRQTHGQHRTGHDFSNGCHLHHRTFRG